jgi:hypothetical protein
MHPTLAVRYSCNLISSACVIKGGIRYNYRVLYNIDEMILDAQNSNQQQVNTTPKHESIAGVVERLTYYSEESGYTVARLPAAIALVSIGSVQMSIKAGLWRTQKCPLQCDAPVQINQSN